MLLKCFYIITSCVLLLGSASHAQRRYEQPEATNAFLGTSGNLADNHTLVTQDPLLLNPSIRPAVTRTNDISNIISFAFNEEVQFGSAAMPDTFTVTLTADIHYTLSGQAEQTITDHIFTLTYSKTHPYSKSDVFFFNNAVKVRVEIKHVVSTGVLLPQVINFLMLSNDIRIDRDYAMTCTGCDITNVSSNPVNTAKDEIDVYWSPSNAAEEYDLEWAFIPSDIDATYTSAPDYPDNIFRNNSTRVSVNKLSYSLPVFYDDAGKLYYRVRAAQVLYSGERVTSDWSTSFGSAGLGITTVAQHEDGLNWQASTTFAEDGKRKSVVQYFDGTLRNRQTVTKDNVTQTTVVAESFYNKQGDPSLQVLPSPTLSNILKFTPLFTRSTNINSPEYDKTQYDTVVNASDICASAAVAMGTTGGAAGYYSANNTEKNTGINKFIPDAEGRPFSETKFYQDNTGRIAAQSGVGETFKLAGGHETKYFYESANQYDLDALFGTEVGEASHYQKNSIKDANGQYSVSYVDMQGRTIATALAGNAPANLDSLASKRDSMQTDQLITASNNIIRGNDIVSTHSFVVKKDGLHKFSYSLDPQTFNLANCSNANICYDCLYNLTITITDDCNNQLLPGKVPYVVRDSNFSLLAINNNCGSAARKFEKTINLILLEGSYTITKTLTISQPGKNYYQEVLYPQNNTCKTYKDIYQEEMTRVKQAINNCYADTVKSSTSNLYREIMEQQVQVPDGIYAKLVTNPNIDPVNFHPEMPILTKWESIADSHAWDDKMDKVFTFQEAVANGYLNPLQMSQQPAARFSSANPDPFFAARPGLKTTMIDRMMNYQNVTASAKSNMWAIANMIIKCTSAGAMDAGCITTYNNTANVFSASLLCTAELDKAWMNFKSFYVTEKMKILERDFLFSGFVASVKEEDRVFVNSAINSTVANYGIDVYVTDTNVLRQQMDAKLAATITDNCKGYAAYWWDKLNACGGFNKTRDSAAIVNRLIEVCKEGGDITHPFGASTIKPGSTLADKSFLDAVQNYVLTLAPADRPDPISCNGSLLDAPGPYEKPMIVGLKQITSKPDSCDCAQIGLMYAKYQQLTATYSSFSDYIKRVYQTTISNSALDSLRNLCSGALNCVTLVNPIPMPPVLQCGGTYTACANCAKVNDANTAFKARYPGVNPSASQDSAIQVSRNHLFTTFMNNKLGFSKTVWEYLDFIQLCLSNTGANPEDSITGVSCYVKDVLQYPSSGITKPSSLNCGLMFQAYNNFIADFPDRTHGAIVKVFVGDSTLPPGRWVDSSFNAKKLFEWYMTQHLGLTGLGYTFNNYADWLINGCATKLNQLPWSDTVYVRSDTLTSIWSRFNTAYSSFPGNITETKSLGIYKPLNLLKYDNGSSNSTYYTSNLVTNRWTSNNGTTPYSTRSTLNFNLGSLPKNAVISNSLFSVEAFPYTPEGAHRRDTAGYPFVQLLPVRGFYIPGVTIWQSQPVIESTMPGYNFAYCTTDRVIYSTANNFYSNQAYRNQNITSVIQKMYDSVQVRRVNYPVLFKLDEDLLGSYRRYSFYSVPSTGIAVSAANAATLNVTYTASHCDVFTAFVNNALGTNLTLQQIKDLYACKALYAINSNCSGYTLLPAPPPTRGNGIYAGGPLLCSNAQPTFEPVLNAQPDVCKDTVSYAAAGAQAVYRMYNDSLAAGFSNGYTSRCLSAVNYEHFSVEHAVSEYHYTLYYYDQAGNLVKTVPPAGVVAHREKSWLDNIAVLRAAGQHEEPAHTLATFYRYNSLNMLVNQFTPDGRQSNFWYDRLGRLAISQNRKQKLSNQYSYTLYDVLGRVTEVGQKTQTASMTDVISRDIAQLYSWTNASNLTWRHTEVTHTMYDRYSGIDGFYDDFVQKKYTLRNRVSYTEFFNQLSYGSTPLNGIYKPNYLYHDQATYYNYDIHGNVDTLLHYYPTGAMASFGNNQFKKIAYNYDLVSGKVNVVSYQPGKQDGFCHRYEYDAENRIRDVYTSTNKAFIGDKNVEDHESASSYYKHGPLARTVIGQNQVQGLDYMYTLQGWLKGVNSPALQPSFDPGGDGNGLTVMPARDAFAFSLGYYIGDYKPINTTVNPIAEAGGYLGSDANKQLFNGNISNMAVGMSGVETQLSAYRYDQLNRLVAMDVYKKLKRPENSWSDIIPANRYAERIAYDGNGNILTYRRDGVETAPAMDQLQYHYTAGTNRLEYIHDDVVSAYTEDIESQAAGNYSYDSIGNLIRDVKEKIQDIQWTVYGKIRQITKDDGTIIQYTYDASGNRISKAVTMAGVTKVTWYVRDAQGNTMAMYALTDASIRLTEQYLYGSSRLGIARKNVTLFNSGAIPATNVSGLGNTYSETLTRGNKLYELSNHLGNVLVTVSDKKLGSLVTGSSSLIDHYEADIRNVQDYYPFGMLMGGRTSTARFCHEEVQDLTTLVVESNLNSGTTTSGNTITQSGIVWKSFNGSSADIHLVSQAAKLEAAASNNGLLIDFAAATFLPNTTYELSFDVPDKSAGVVTLGCTIQNNGDQPVRVAGNKTGTGRQSLIFTTPATIPTSWLLRISSLQYGTGWYFVVDNFMIRKYNAAAETPIYIETFDNAVMNGANIESNGHLWKPKFATGSPVSLAGTSGALKAKVTCTTVNESYLETEVDVTGGKSYLMKFSLAQDLSKRILLSIYYRTGSTWTIMETGGASYKGNGDYRLNFTIPTGASAVRASFSRYSGTVDDAPDLPYTIDNFSINRLDTMSSQMINVCEDDGLDENGKKEEAYRYGFNGKENDDDISGIGSKLDFGARIYDPRLGRWLSTDPLERNYVAFSPYCFAINSPLILIDYDGRDIIIVTSTGTSRLAKETLLKTPTGRALWNKYAKSKTDDVYIAVSSFPKGTNANAMTQYGIEGTSMIKTEAYLNKDKKAALRNLIAVDSKDKNQAGFEALQGTDVTKSSGKKIHLIVLNKDSYSDAESKRKTYADDYNAGNLDEAKYDLGESLFHEIKAHIDMHGTKDEHKAYGKSVNGVFRTDILPTKGTPSETIKNELKALYDKEQEAKKPKVEEKKDTSTKI